MTNLEYRELRDLRKAREQGNDLIGFVLCIQAISMALLVAIFILILIQNAGAEEIAPKPEHPQSMVMTSLIIDTEYKTAETECENTVIEYKTEENSNLNPENEIFSQNTEDNCELEYLGVFTTTGYCNCRKCCGKWAGGPTASGNMPRANHTVAVDPKVIPLGTHLLVNGIEYVAEDTGSGVNGKHLDIYYDSHQTAWNHGVQKLEVWMIKEEKE